MADFSIKRHDTRPAIEALLSALSTDVIDTVRFLMRDIATDTLVVNTTASIAEQPSTAGGGRVKYQWQTGNTAAAGEYRAEFEVTFDDARVETYPNNGYINVHILEDLGP